MGFLPGGISWIGPSWALVVLSKSPASDGALRALRTSASLWGCRRIRVNNGSSHDSQITIKRFIQEDSAYIHYHAWCPIWYQNIFTHIGLSPSSPLHVSRWYVFIWWQRTEISCTKLLIFLWHRFFWHLFRWPLQHGAGIAGIVV